MSCVVLVTPVSIPRGMSRRWAFLRAQSSFDDAGEHPERHVAVDGRFYVSRLD